MCLDPGLSCRTTGARWWTSSSNLGLEVKHLRLPGVGMVMRSLVVCSLDRNTVMRTARCVLFPGCSGEELPGALPAGVGGVQGPRGSPEEASGETLCGGAAAARALHARQEQHHHRLRTGELSLSLTSHHTHARLSPPPMKDVACIVDKLSLCCLLMPA